MSIQRNLNFHQTFKPERQYISSLIEIANNCNGIGIKEISRMTGIPTGEISGKVEPHIQYANYMGLLDSKKKDGLYYLKLSNLGQNIMLEDIGIQENLTLLLCHCMMLRERKGAELWSYIFRKIFPKYKNIIKIELFSEELKQQYGSKIKIAPFNGSYSDIFGGLSILTISEDNIKMNKMPYNKEYIYLYAYILYEYWDEFYKEQDEITSIQLEKVCFGEAFGWDKKEEYEVLEKLTDKNIVRMNRQLMPYTILKLMDKKDIISRLYSELC